MSICASGFSRARWAKPPSGWTKSFCMSTMTSADFANSGPMFGDGICLSSAVRRGLAADPHQVEDRQEELRLLRAGNGVLAGEDEARDGVDAHAPGAAVLRQHVRQSCAAGEEAARRDGIEPGLVGDRGQSRALADIA